MDLEDQNLKFAQPDANGQWNPETIDASPNAGWSNSLFLDLQGTPVISYFDSHLQSLKLASREAGKWNVEILDDNGCFYLPSETPTTKLLTFLRIVVL